MASDESRLALLTAGTKTPIAQLNPELPDPQSRVVHGEITITWPYNSVTNTLAFLLAEPDVRLRRDHGQVRIQLQGPGARALADLGCGGGDELLLSLDGAEWAKHEPAGRAPGSQLEWQLHFPGRLLLQVSAYAHKHISVSPRTHPADFTLRSSFSNRMRPN